LGGASKKKSEFTTKKIYDLEGKDGTQPTTGVAIQRGGGSKETNRKVTVGRFTGGILSLVSGGERFDE